MDELARQNAEQRGLLDQIAENWRNEAAKNREEILAAIRETAGVTVRTTKAEERVEECLKLKSLELKEKLEKVVASRDAFSSQVSSPEGAGTAPKDPGRAELAETKEKYDRLMVDSDAELVALQIRVSDVVVSLGSHLIAD